MRAYSHFLWCADPGLGANFFLKKFPNLEYFPFHTGKQHQICRHWQHSWRE